MARPIARLSSLPPSDDEMVVIPRRWMQEITDKLDLIQAQALRPMHRVEEPTTDDGYISKTRAAKRAGYSCSTITRWVLTGKLKAYGPRRNRFSREEIDALMRKANTGEVTDEEAQLAGARTRLADKKK